MRQAVGGGEEEQHTRVSLLATGATTRAGLLVGGVLATESPGFGDLRLECFCTVLLCCFFSQGCEAAVALWSCLCEFARVWHRTLTSLVEVLPTACTTQSRRVMCWPLESISRLCLTALFCLLFAGAHPPPKKHSRRFQQVRCRFGCGQHFWMCCSAATALHAQARPPAST